MDATNDLEITELRRRSPLKSRRIFATFIFAILFITAALVSSLLNPDVPLMGALVVVAVVVFIAAIFFVYYYMKAKALIDNGVIVDADLVSVFRLVNSLYRVKVSYTLNDKTWKKAFLMSTLYCGLVERNKKLKVVASRTSPRFADPLFAFAKSRSEAKAIANCERGLLPQLAK